MTARARITKEDMALAVKMAKEDGVVVTITSPSGKVFTVSPPPVQPVLDDFDRVDMRQR